ncbi:MAG: aminopeptidase P family protein [Sphaerobacteraceae bacterium]|nr:MAG: aminopeptidase P family protein [Sphaerobacteraceae bacterium]
MAAEERRAGDVKLTDRELVFKYGYPAMEVPFSIGEYKVRLRMVQAAMAERGIDVLLAMAPESMFYLSGYQNEWYQAQSPKDWIPWSGVAVHVDRDDFILFDNLGEAILCRFQTVATDARFFDRKSASPIESIVNELKGDGWLPGTVALEMRSYRPNRIVSEKYQAAFEDAGCTVVDGTDIMRDVRLIKSPLELAYMESAARIADIGLQAARDTIEAGVTELEVYGEIIRAMAKAGGENPGITLPVLSGLKSTNGHALASRKQILPGEMVFVDVCGVYNRYHVNIARNFSVGEPHLEVQEKFDKAAGVFDIITDILKPRMEVEVLNDAVQSYYEEVGIWEDRGYIGGYELGISFPPDWVGEFNYGPHVPSEGQFFRPGMVVNHESQFFMPLNVGYHMQIDSLIFTENEARLMGTTPRELMVVGS